jgi:hypothetical protein
MSLGEPIIPTSGLDLKYGCRVNHTGFTARHVASHQHVCSLFCSGFNPQTNKKIYFSYLGFPKETIENVTK